MSFNKSRAGFILVIFLMAISLPFAFGQGINTGGIVGTIVDQSQAGLSGATIKAVKQDTNTEFSGTSNATGSFSLLGLPVGPYTVSISAPNFSSVKVAGLQVLSGVNTALGTQVLKVGATGETVEVEGSAPIVEPNSSQITTSFGNRQVAELPVGSGFDALALLIPGVASTGDAGFSNNNGAGLSVNGQRGRSNNFQIDGQSNNDNSVAGPQFFIGNQDIISEVQIVTNNFSAEYGRNMGSVVNYITKTGTNAYHGTAFEFYTGSFADSLANQSKSGFFGFCPKGVAEGTSTVFASGVGVDGCKKPRTPHFTENRYGGTFGGPIVKDKLWFFGSGMRDYAGQTNTSTSTAVAPTPAGLLLLENTYCGVNFATYTPDPCPSHPALGAYLVNGPFANKYGNPITGGGAQVLAGVTDGVTTIDLPVAQFKRSVPAAAVDNEASGRIDWQATSKDRVFGRYLFQRTFSADAAGTTSTGAFVDIPGQGQELGLDWVRNVTSNFLNQARFSFSKTTVSFEGQRGGPKQFANCTVANINGCPTRIDFSGQNLASAGIATNLPQARLVKVTSYQDNAQWVRGRHTVKFGGEFDHQFSPNDFLPNTNGRFRFSSFSALLSNKPNSVSIADGVVKLNFKENDLAFYGQDDWKILDNLTLNLGLRWEWNQQAINLLHDLTVKRETGPNPFWDPTLPLAVRTVPRVPEALRNFGPNVGFAFTPRGYDRIFGDGKTVIRGGFRIAYDPSFYNIFLNVATSAPTLNAATLSRANRPVPAGILYNGTEIRAAKLPLIPLGVDPRGRTQTQVTHNFHNPYSEQYSLGLQREITPKIAAEVRYVGNHTVGNFQTLNANPALFHVNTQEDLTALFPGIVPPGVTRCAAPGPGAGEGRIDCTHGLVRLRANSAYSFYNGLQTELRLRGFHGLTGSVGYTYSRTIDNVSEIFSTFAGGNSIAGSQNFFDNKLAERNVNGTSYPHVVTVSYIYDFPFYKSQEGFAGKVLGGWETSGIYAYRSGQPYTVVQAGGLDTYCDDTFNFTFFGASTCRPVISNPKAPIDSVGACTSSTVPGCAPVDIFGGTATQFRYIYNDTVYANSVKNPFGGSGRNTLRGQTNNNLDVSLFKNLKASERITMKFGVTALNVLNRQYLGVPDPVIEDGKFDISGNSVTNPAFNPGGTYGNSFGNASGIRRLNFGLRIIF